MFMIIIVVGWAVLVGAAWRTLACEHDDCVAPLMRNGGRRNLIID